MNLPAIGFGFTSLQMILELQWGGSVLVDALANPCIDISRPTIRQQLSIRDQIDGYTGKPVANAGDAGVRSHVQRAEMLHLLERLQQVVRRATGMQSQRTEASCQFVNTW